jgi:hypothetical protein
MRRMLLLLTAAMLVAVMAVATAGPAMAQVPPHRHLLDPPGPNENVEIFQGFCREAAPQGALENVHENVHLGQPVTKAFASNPVAESTAPCPPQP